MTKKKQLVEHILKDEHILKEQHRDDPTYLSQVLRKNSYKDKQLTNRTREELEWIASYPQAQSEVD